MNRKGPWPVTEIRDAYKEAFGSMGLTDLKRKELTMRRAFIRKEKWGGAGWLDSSSTRAIAIHDLQKIQHKIANTEVK